MKTHLTLSIMLIFIVGCSNQSATFNTFNDQDVTLIVDVISYSDKFKEAVTLNIHNKNASEIRYGVPYKIEELYLGTWREIPFFDDDPAWTQVEIILHPYETNQQPIFLNQFKEKIKIGQPYRVIKSFNTEDGRKITLAAEFMIGDDYVKAQKALELNR